MSEAFKPLLGRFDLPALTAAGGLSGSLLFLPFENSGALWAERS